MVHGRPTRRRRRFGFEAALLAALVAFGWEASAVRAAPLFFVPHASGFSQVTDIANAGDSRLFVVEQAGTIRVVQSDGTVLATPFLDISSKVSCCGERGLLGLAFHPDYPINGFFYVDYTDAAGDTVVARYSVSADPDLADPASEVVLLTQAQPFPNHNAGDLAFGPADGFLYVTLGDGGLFCDPSDNAQDGQSLLGKILRIDVDGGTPFAIPPDNPFVGDPSVRDEVWALGLRNPWRIAFDPAPPHDLFIGDVGQNMWEEVDFQPGASGGGENYGWDCLEGTHLASDPPSSCTTTVACPPAGHVLPIHEYDHSGGRCAVTGGVVYRGSAFPSLDGEYFFADFCSGEAYSLSPDGGGGWTLTSYDTPVPGTPRTFGTDASGEIYVATSTAVYRIEGPPPPLPSCPATPNACDAPAKAVLLLKDRPPAGPGEGDRLVFRYVRGPAASQDRFGDPTQTTDMRLCLYAGAAPTLLLEAVAAGGGICGGPPCWKALGSRGYAFKDPSASQDGLLRIVLRGHPSAAKTKIVWKGKDAALALPALPLDASAPVSVRVLNSSNGFCWGADFAPSDVRRNDATAFRAVAGP